MNDEIRIHRQINKKEKVHQQLAVQMAMLTLLDIKDPPRRVGPAPQWRIPYTVLEHIPPLMEHLNDEEMTLDQSRLLGLHFDRRMTFYRQMMKIKQGLSKARQATGRLSGSTFGASKKELCEFHTTFARSRELYAIETFYHLLSTENQARLCSMDREGIRKAVGLMPGAKELNLIYESELRPLSIEIKMKQAIYYERTIRLGGSQTARALQPPPRRTIKEEYMETPMQICREAAESILQWAKIPPDSIRRQPIYRVPMLAPWARKNSTKITIIPKIAPGARKADLTTEEQYKLVEEVVAKHLKWATIQFWTDGSSHIILRLSGAAALIYTKKDGIWSCTLQLTSAAGKLACSFTSESVALKEVLRELLILLTDLKEQKIVGFIDCSSLLDKLDKGSVAQEDPDLGIIWEFLLAIGSHHEIILQHIYSHCGIKESDAVDALANEAAMKCPQDKFPTTYRDSKALIKQWGKQMTKNRMENFEMHPALAITKQEASWSRERQVLAAQIRADQVRIVGHWPRRLEKEMPLSCRFCTPEDHRKEEIQPISGPRGSRDTVQCPVCKHEYKDVGKYNRHLKTGKGLNTCSKTAEEIHIKGKKPEEKKKTEEGKKSEKTIVPRRPHTGPEETLSHVMNDCVVAKARWGPHNGKMDGMVTMLQNIKHHFDEEREKGQMADILKRKGKPRE